MSNIVEKSDPFVAPACGSCKHYQDGKTCAAFKLIPKEILVGDNNHKVPLPNQKNNIVYSGK